MEEIIDRVFWEIRHSGFERKLIGGIVLTGGGALLRNLDKLVEFNTGMTTRVGLPIDHLAHGYAEEVCSPIYATAIGLMLKAAEDLEAGRIKLPTTETKPETNKTATPQNKGQESIVENQEGSWFSRLFEKTKAFFEADPDSEFDK
jgi:cell division protein FtsA